jgi:hypothetical protein
MFKKPKEKSLIISMLRSFVHLVLMISAIFPQLELQGDFGGLEKFSVLWDGGLQKQFCLVN